MSDTPTETIERRRRDAYRVENTVSCLRGGRAVAWVWFAITPPFLIVDFSRFPEQAQTLMWMRLFSLFIPLGMLAVLAIPLGKRRPKETVLGFTAIGAANTLVMMACTGGHASPYSAGIGLAMLLAALLMPWPSSWTWLTCSVLIAEYLVAGPILAFEGGDRMIANNLFSYVATAMIAGFATVSRERLRWREFLARDALQDSESRLKDEAEISQALAIAGREMIELLDAPRILHRLCRLTTQLLRCEVSHTILWDRERDLWRGVAEYGDTQEQWETLRQVEVPTSRILPVLERLSHEGIIQLSASDPEYREPGFDAVRRTGITSTMFVALRAGSEVIGVQTAGFRGRTERFSAQQETIASGIAQLGSMALANARLTDELARQTESEQAARSVAEVANRVKDNFLATLSHELRTPLNVILGYLEMLGDESIDVALRRDVLARLGSASKQLLYMITDTLEISRLQSGRSGPAAAEPIPLDEVWAQIEGDCETLPREPGVEVRWNRSVPPLILQTDRQKLLVILRNLVGNGLKFTDEGFVEVAADLESDDLVFRVSDSGIGISLDEQGRIFEMFHQVDESDSRRHGGVGLGLYIVRQFVEQLGGRVEVESQPRRGSTFAVRFPIEGCAVRVS